MLDIGRGDAGVTVAGSPVACWEMDSAMIGFSAWFVPRTL